MTEDNNMATQSQEAWRGYSLEELRYQRALTAVRVEMEKEKLMHRVNELKRNVPTMSVSKSGLMGKVMKSLNYVDYVVLAFGLGRAASRFFKMFRRSK